MHRVLVYGSLKKGFGNHTILGDSEFLGVGKIKGKLYSLGYYPGAKLDEEGEITGELYEVSDATLARLDRLEGHPNYYRRTRVPCDLGVVVEVYHYSGDVSKRTLVESGVWK